MSNNSYVPTHYGTPTKPSFISKRSYKAVCLGAFVIYTVLNFSISNNSICTADIKFPPWRRDVNLLVTGWFMASAFLQLIRTVLSTFKEENDIGTLSSYYASFIVNFIGGIANVCILMFEWGGICRDGFGIHTSAAVWVEGLVSAPLLCFIVVSVDDKSSLDWDDYAIVVSMFLCVFCCAMRLTTTDLHLTVAYTVLAGLFFIAAPYLAYRSARELWIVERIKQNIVNTNKEGTIQRRVLLSSRKYALACAVGILFPVFPFIYCLRLLGYLDDSTAIVLTTLHSSFVKLMFSTLCMDANLEVSHPAVMLIDRERFTKSNRHHFLRYVFHEVRSPLNSIALGLQILSASSDKEPPDAETLDMMRYAVSYMGETLNDVMTLQKIEEGSMNLIFKEFYLSDLVINIQDSFEEILKGKGITLQTSVSKFIPAKMIGDKFRICHVLENLVSNAVHASPRNSVIKLHVTSEHSTLLSSADLRERKRLISFSIEDEGCGISASDQQADIFQPYKTLKPGELISKGGGLGLAICREIVQMHHGWIGYTSEENVGSVFKVTIPLVAVESTGASPINQNSNDNNTKRPKRLRLDRGRGDHIAVLRPEEDATSSPPQCSPSNHVYSLAHARSATDLDGSSRTNSLRSGKVEAGDAAHVQSTFNALSPTSFDISGTAEDSTPDLHRWSASRSSDALDSRFLGSTPGTPHGQLEASRLPLSTTDQIERSWKHYKQLATVGTSSHNNAPDNAQHIPMGNTQVPITSMSTINVMDTSVERVELTTSSASVSAQPQKPHLEAVAVKDRELRTERENRDMYSLPTTFTRPPPLIVGNTNVTTVGCKSKTGSLNTNSNEAIATDGSYNGCDSLNNTSRELVVEGKVSPLYRRPEILPVIPSNSTENLRSMLVQSSTGDAVIPSPKFDEEFKKFNILLVDDVLSNRKLLAMLLHKKGIKSISFAEDGEVGVDTVIGHGVDYFDIIFMDNTMPVKSGVEATKELRTLGYNRMIIGLTGNSFEDELRDFEEVGADIVLTKPMKPNMLQQLLAFLGSNGSASIPDMRLRWRDEGIVWVPVEKLRNNKTR